jgi:hypothetical protein
VQSLIPFTEDLMPDAEASAYRALLRALEKNKPESGRSVLDIARENLETIRDALTKLKQHILANPFANAEQEIRFFKITKPHFHALLEEWSGVIDLELWRPLGGRRAEEKYMARWLHRIRNFFQDEAEFFSYYRSGKTERDAVYFQRVSPPDLELDGQYTTGKDRLLARLLGYERLQRYIEKSIRELKNTPAPNDSPTKKSALRWTGSKAGLVELIYALHSGGVCNHGNADIKFIAHEFEQLFQFELTNFYHVFNEIRLRKKGRTQMLDSLKESITRKMDELDER